MSFLTTESTSSKDGEMDNLLVDPAPSFFRGRLSCRAWIVILATTLIMFGGIGLAVTPRWFTHTSSVAKAVADDTIGLRKSAVSKASVIVDTDVDIDDMMALIYVLNDPSVDLKGITVETNGWSMQWAGLVNVMRLTQKYGLADIPVAFSETYAVTQLNGKWGSHPNELPPPSWLNGTSTYLTNWLPTAFNRRPPSSMSAPELILHALDAAPKADKVDILALGPWTNLATALHRNRELFLSKVGKIYVSGGKINQPGVPPQYPVKAFNKILSVADTKKSDEGGFPYKTTPKGSDWNIFLDPISAEQVVASGVDLVFMTSNAEDMLTVNKTDFKYIPKDCPAAQRKYLTDFYLHFGPSGDQTMSEVRYWDPSAAVLMTQMQQGLHQQICNKSRRMTLSVDLEDGPQYSWTTPNDFGTDASVCLAADVEYFKEAYYSGACRCPISVR